MATDGPERATWREWVGLAVLTLPLLMTAADMSVLFLALPSIAADLGPGSTQLLWITHVCDFLAVGFALTMGRLVDRLGARRVLVAGAAVYGLASLAAAYAPAPEALIGMRAVLGIASATVMPAVLSLLRPMFRAPAQFSLAVAVVMSAFSVGMAVGPPLGGLLLEHFWWGAVFLINAPVVAVLLLSAPLLPAGRGAGAGRVDMPSVLLSLGAILSVVYGFQEIADARAGGGGEAVWPHAAVVAAGLVLGALFVRRQLRLADPLLDLRLFAIPAFSVSLGGMLLMLLAYGGADLLLTQFLQTVLGLPPGRVGLLMVAPAAAALASGMAAPLLTRMFGPVRTMAGGLLLAGAAAAGMAVLVGRADPAVLIALVTVIALAVGPLFPVFTELVVGSAPEERSGTAAAVNDVGGGLGQALSVAALGSISLVLYQGALRDTAPEDAPEAAVRAAGESIGGAGAVAEGLPGEAGRALLDSANAAFTTGVQGGYAFGAVLLVLAAAVVGWFLRGGRADASARRKGAEKAGPEEGAAEGAAAAGTRSG
ncbi:MFS transporter [Nocardiopsis sp. CNT-189]|uniref:MFS transporter n=1 Tax=Nocardiopsis oceanisediminis TaxID=2816862 RepID=UPI003B39F09A